MKIAVLGYCNADASQNGVRIAQSWTIQGHNVRTYNFSDPPELTIDNIIRFKPGFCLVTMGREWPHEYLLKLKENNIFLANWIADEYGPDDFGGIWMNKIKGIYNLLMCETKGIIPLIKDFADDVIWIPQFFDERYHKCTEKRLQQDTFDLGFLGGQNKAQSTVRMKFLNNLIAENYDIKIAHGGLINGAMASFYAHTKIGLNFINDLLPSYELALSNRAFKTVGSGCFLLTPCIKGLEDLLIPGKHCATYIGDDYLDLKDKIAFFLKNDTIREEIARQGQQHILKNYTIDIITKSFIDEIIKRSK
jgi:hypothetical protein